MTISKSVYADNLPQVREIKGDSTLASCKM